MPDRVKRLLNELEDYLRYHPIVQGLVSRYKFVKVASARGKDDQSIAVSISQLCAAARISPNASLTTKIETQIRNFIDFLTDPRKVRWESLLPGVTTPVLEKAVIVKPFISPKERGVLFLSFENQWAKLLRYCNLRELADQFIPVIAPTWSPPHSLVNYAFPAFFPGIVFSLISNQVDLEITRRMGANIVVLPLLASHWVNPTFYQVRSSGKKTIDITMVANFGKYKRHHALFKAIRGLSPRPKLVLIGQKQGGRSEATILEEARCYGVHKDIHVLANPSNEVVADTLSRSKISVILSRREGSCVVVAESMFAGTPVGLLTNAHIGSRIFINEKTGRFLRQEKLSSDLVDFLREADSYSPREWAEENISCFKSSRILNDLLKQKMIETGNAWTQDIAPLCWRPNPELVYEKDRKKMQECYEDFRRRFGLRLEAQERESLIEECSPELPAGQLQADLNKVKVIEGATALN